ncbi:MAG TPA: STAS domain-containing protein [Gemmatimonadaceae bacterium]
MTTTDFAAIDVFRSYSDELLHLWQNRLTSTGAAGDFRNKSGEMKGQTQDLLRLITEAARSGQIDNIQAEPWKPVRSFLDQLSSDRARQGYSSTQTATFVFSLKEPLYNVLRREVTDPTRFAGALWEVNDLVDQLALFTMASFQQSREQVIVRQQEEMLELSTPVVKLWEGILALPMIGTLDSARTQVVMESLLQRIVETGSAIAIIDITGVPTVDTLVAQHLLKTVTAIRLMGADCIISGVRPQIAQTIVHLGVNLQGISTKATLADALAVALERTGRSITSKGTT